MNLYSKLNNSGELNKLSKKEINGCLDVKLMFVYFKEALNEITELFKNFKEYEIKLNRLKEKIVQAEKLEKKRVKELEKCPSNKNIRDYEVRLYQIQSEKEKLEIECN